MKRLPRPPARLARCASALAALALLLAACAVRDASSGEQPIVDTEAVLLGEQQVINSVWQALEPNTSSHNQAAWEVVEVQTVTGSDVQDVFEDEPVPGGCAPGPTPPDNATIAPNGSYWYVLMQPLAATSRPVPTEQYSPTAPPRVPEPFVYQAHFLLNARTGQIVARKIACVIY